MTWRGLVLLAVLAGVVGPAALVAASHGSCRQLGAADVPDPEVVEARTDAGSACAKAVIRDW